MEQTLTKYEADKILRATPARHKALKILAAQRGLSLIEVTDEVLEAGLRHGSRPAQDAPSPATN